MFMRSVDHSGMVSAYCDSVIARRINESHWICRYRLEGVEHWLLKKTGFMNSSSAAPVSESCRKVVLVLKFLVVPSQSNTWEKQGSREGCVHIFLSYSWRPSSFQFNWKYTFTKPFVKWKFSLAFHRHMECSLEWVSISPTYKKNPIILTMKAKYKWEDPTDRHMKYKSRRVMHALVKEVNWPFLELSCMTLIPWTTRYAFSMYSSSCQSPPVLMCSNFSPLVHKNWRSEPLIQGWIASTANPSEGRPGRYGCSSQGFHSFCTWDLLSWYCWKDIWLQKAVSIYLQAPLHLAKRVPRG